MSGIISWNTNYDASDAADSAGEYIPLQVGLPAEYFVACSFGYAICAYSQLVGYAQPIEIYTFGMVDAESTWWFIIKAITDLPLLLPKHSASKTELCSGS